MALPRLILSEEHTGAGTTSYTTTATATPQRGSQLILVLGMRDNASIAACTVGTTGFSIDGSWVSLLSAEFNAGSTYRRVQFLTARTAFVSPGSGTIQVNNAAPIGRYLIGLVEIPRGSVGNIGSDATAQGDTDPLAAEITDIKAGSRIIAGIMAGGPFGLTTPTGFTELLNLQSSVTTDELSIYTRINEADEDGAVSVAGNDQGALLLQEHRSNPAFLANSFAI